MLASLTKSDRLVLWKQVCCIFARIRDKPTETGMQPCIILHCRELLEHRLRRAHTDLSGSLQACMSMPSAYRWSWI